MGNNSDVRLLSPNKVDQVRRTGQRPISRRQLLGRGLCGAASLLLANRLGSQTHAAAPKAKAKSVIQIWMWGGPSHIDTFDPKPDAGNAYCGQLIKF